MNKAHEIKLHPTKKQQIFFAKSCGVARFAYNWALDNWNKKYEAKDEEKVIKESNDPKTIIHKIKGILHLTPFANEVEIINEIKRLFTFI